MGEAGGSQETNVQDSERGTEFDIDHLHSLWVRWPNIRDGERAINLEFEGAPIGDIHLHRYCDISPFTSIDRDFEPELKFVTGPLRTGLRVTPMVILTVVVAMILYGELSPAVQGVSVFLPDVPQTMGLFAGGAILLWAVILALAGRVDLIDEKELISVTIVFGLILTLAVGTTYSIYAVVTADNPTTLPPNIVFLSGYLLMLLLGGLLVYDGMLRTEFMIEHFGDWSHSIVPPEQRGQYGNWREGLANDLTDALYEFEMGDTEVRIRTAYIFATVFVAQFGVLWWIAQGPQNLNSSVTLAVNVFLDFFIVVIAFQFLILIKHFHNLVTDAYVNTAETKAVTSGTGQKIIQYEPFHIDQHGGFKDFGRFATRVNVLLILGGAYTVYRLYVQGLRVLPPTGLSGFESQFLLLFWIGSYVVPIFAYGVAAIVWLYYSFWAMHRKMILDKQALFIEEQGNRDGDGSVPAVGDPVDDLESGPDWTYLHAAPEWPINSRWLISLASANFAPVILPVFQVL